MSIPEFRHNIQQLSSIGNEIEKLKQERLVVTDEGKVHVMQRTDRGSIGTLGPTLERINYLINQTIQQMSTEKDLSNINFFGLEKKIHQIETWADRSVASYDQRRNFLHLIPFSNWRKTRLENQGKVHAQLEALKSNVAGFKAESKRAQVKSSKNSIVQNKEEFKKSAKEGSRKIQELVQGKQGKLSGSEMAKLFEDVSAELGEIKSSADKLTFACRNVRENIKHMEGDPQIAALMQEAAKEMEAVIQETNKITNSAIIFLEGSYPDLNGLFFVPQLQGDIKASLATNELTSAQLLLTHCQKLLQKKRGNEAGLTLSYAKLKKSFEECKKQNNEAHTEYEDFIKRREPKMQTEIKGLEAELKKLQSPGPFGRLKVFFSSRYAQNIEKQKKDLSEKIDKKKLEITKETKFINKMDKEYAAILEGFEALSSQLVDLKIINKKQELEGNIDLKMENPLFNGIFSIPSDQLEELADAYRRYVDRLEKLQSASALASTACSQTGESIKEKLGLG